MKQSHSLGREDPVGTKDRPAPLHGKDATDVFIERPDHDFHYKTLNWQVSNRARCHRTTQMLASVRFLANDSRDCQQRNAIPSLGVGCCRCEQNYGSCC